MIMLRIFLLSLLIFSSLNLRAESSKESAVTDWSLKAGLSDLKNIEMKNEDIELRIWSGFGILGNHAVIIRRINGSWESTLVTIQYYNAGATEEIAKIEGYLSPCIVESMSSRCLIHSTKGDDNKPYEYSLECPYLEPTYAGQKSYIKLWEQLVNMKLLSLPKRIYPNLKTTDGSVVIIRDGHHYVIELRRGSYYQLTEVGHIDYIKDSNMIDLAKNVESMACKIDKLLGSSLRLESRFGGNCE